MADPNPNPQGYPPKSEEFQQEQARTQDFFYFYRENGRGFQGYDAGRRHKRIAKLVQPVRAAQAGNPVGPGFLNPKKRDESRRITHKKKTIKRYMAPYQDRPGRIPAWELREASVQLLNHVALREVLRAAQLKFVRTLSWVRGALESAACCLAVGVAVHS